MTQPTPLYFFGVSKLSHFDFCPKRSKIELFGRANRIEGTSKGPVYWGNKLHFLYSYPYKSFDRILLLSKIPAKLQKQLGIVMVKGVLDDLRVIRNVRDNLKFTVLIEVKTTSKKYMWGREIKAAVRQLQLYMWLLRDLLKALGFPLWKRGYVEIYSQKTGIRMRRIPVGYDEQIEEWILNVVDCFKGLKRVSAPYLRACKFCPRNVRSVCDWHALMVQAKKGY